MIKIIGDAPEVERLQTGLYSFDRAFINRKGNIGFPLGKYIELYGATHTGKSTIIYGLSGTIANHLGGNIALADLEGFDPDFLVDVLETSGFDGEVQYVQEETDEDTLESLISVLKQNEYVVGILDSIGAVSPVSEQQGDIGEANMGRRAFSMAQFSRKVVKLLREHDNKTMFTVNHAYPRIGGLGYSSPGGEVKNYLFSIRIHVKRRYVKSGWQEYPDGSYVIEGKITKNRWGIKDKEFLLFVLSGKGMHKGMTAMFDCIELGLATSKNVVKIGDKSFGRLKPIIDEAQSGNEQFFEPFYELLVNHKLEVSTDVENEEEDENEN